MTLKNFTVENIFFALVFLSSAAYAADQPTLPKAPYLPPQEVRAWQKTAGRDLVIVDVRDRKEYKIGHIPGAINVPYDKVERRAKEFKRAKKSYVFYCIYSAWRAPYAANSLADLGYKNVYILQGGISAWNAGGQVIYPKGQAVPALIKIAPYSHTTPAPLKHPRDRVYAQPIDLTVKQLAQYNGKNGQPAYVAVDGIIYDVTESRLWRGGVHDPSEGRATAGRDLTEIFHKYAPHGKDHLERFPVVGRLVKDTP